MGISSKLRLFVICLAAIGAMSVAGAAAASAAPATFNVPSEAIGQAVMSGSLNVTNGTKSTTCNVANRKLLAYNTSGQGVLVTDETFIETTTCANGAVFSLKFRSPATNNGSGFVVTNIWTSEVARSPFAYGGVNVYANAPYALPFVNGSGSTQSKLVFSETTLGTMPGGGGTIKATGTLNVRKTDGSLLLLS